jgi:CelD/BcsL family acetyltransferase involved in cellulose biosynthesis
MTSAPNIELVRDEAALSALLPEWSELWDRAAAATPFQSPAWLVPWLRCFGGRDWVIAVMRRDGRLVGMLPLFLVDDAHGRRLLPMGAGISDYLDGVFDSGVGRGEATFLIAALEEWQGLDLPQLPRASPLLDAPAPYAWSDDRQPMEPCPVLSLPAVLPRRIRQNLRYYRRRIERGGIVHAIGTRRDEALALLEDLFTLHGARWRSCGSPGVLADETVRRFHRGAVSALASLGLLRMHVLHRDGTPVAVGYMLAAKGRAYDYITGFDPEVAQLGAGTVLIGCAIEAATAEGAREFDFLRGREAYKYRWGARDRPTFGRRLRSRQG